MSCQVTSLTPSRHGGPASHRDRQRLSDIQAAIDAIRSHLQRGTLTDGISDGSHG
jgi:hypothetical protein